MVTLLHVADVHLVGGEERDYSLGVLREVVRLAQSHQVAAVMVAGDLFDSPSDAAALSSEVSLLLGELQVPLILVPGNGEPPNAQSGDLQSSLGDKVQVLHEVPFRLATIASGDCRFEVLAVPFQPRYSEYRSWVVPAKSARHRLALAHAVVTGMGSRPEDILTDEERGGALDSDLFVRFQVDYAALGHVHHAPPAQQRQSTTLAYAGSARVWRQGESGPRRALLVDLDAPQSPRALSLEQAGQYRHIDVPLPPDGDLTLPSSLQDCSALDWVHLKLSGVVDQPGLAEEFTDRLHRELEGKVRRLSIDRDGVEVVPGVATEPVVHRFLETWAKREPAPGSEEHEVWMVARQVGMRQLARQIAGRR